MRHYDDYIKYFPKGSKYRNSSCLPPQILPFRFKPESGEFYIADPEKCNNWRRDSHTYTKEKGRITIKYYKITKTDTMRVYYSMKTGLNTLKRRAYMILDSNRHILVHYYDEGIFLKRFKDLLRML